MSKRPNNKLENPDPHEASIRNECRSEGVQRTIRIRRSDQTRAGRAPWTTRKRTKTILWHLLTYRFQSPPYLNHQNSQESSSAYTDMEESTTHPLHLAAQPEPDLGLESFSAAKMAQMDNPTTTVEDGSLPTSRIMSEAAESKARGR